jgi:hypothetical protein
MGRGKRTGRQKSGEGLKRTKEKKERKGLKRTGRKTYGEKKKTKKERKERGKDDWMDN